MSPTAKKTGGLGVQAQRRVGARHLGGVATRTAAGRQGAPETAPPVQQPTARDEYVKNRCCRAETSQVETERCAACGAGMPADAPWCTLCLAPRPAPEPERLVVAAVPASSLYPVITPARFGRPAPVDSAQDASVEAAERTWPCVACGSTVSMSADRCTACGAGFLGGLAIAAPSLRVPLIGVDLAQRGRGTTYAVAAGLGLLVAALLIGVVLLAAAIF